MIMENYVDGKKPTIKTVMIEEFAEELDKILNLYKEDDNYEITVSD